MTSAASASAGPVHERGLDQLDTDEHDGGAGDEGREELLEDLGRHEGQDDFEKGAERRRAEDCTVASRARQLGAIRRHGTIASGIHLGEAT